MKNIHVLPTDKPSRLSINCQTNLLQLGLENRMFHDDRNIYITSDEEIKEKDWCYDSSGEQILHFNNRVGVLLANQQKEKYGNKSFFKILLTTDQDLIKDGVQAIDDEFLEWFVKNPSCEEVKINYEIYKKAVGLITSDWRVSKDDKYKIIIPKEEPKQDLEKEMFELEQELDIPSHLRWHNSKPKQETLEEAVLRVKSENEHYIDEESFELGAKWQAERMYSEEEVGELVYNIIGEYGKHYGIMIDGSKLNELFEQFKKK